jgi:hypothetical protein
MRGVPLAVIAVAAACLGGCVFRWQPQATGRVVMTRACTWNRAPNVADFGPAGVRGAYSFATQNASDAELGALIRNTGAGGFSLALVIANLNGRDAMFAQGPAALRSQREVDREFRTACRLGQGRVYLTHVRYNPARQAGDVRVR